MAVGKGTGNGERIRGAGLKLTAQRLAVLDYLQHVPGHPTAEQIGAELNRRRAPPSITPCARCATRAS
jgi:Fe2+ or Zn2+ uptake regulation protein